MYSTVYNRSHVNVVIVTALDRLLVDLTAFITLDVLEFFNERFLASKQLQRGEYSNFTQEEKVIGKKTSNDDNEGRPPPREHTY